MPIIITITFNNTKLNNNTYHYNDKIYQNIINKNYEIYYSGQTCGIRDYELLNAINNKEEIKIYYRCKTSPFIYLGYTTESYIINKRKVPINQNAISDELLKLCFIIKIENITNKEIPRISNNSYCKYKSDVLIHAGILNNKEEEILKTNRCLSVGFYYYKNNKLKQQETTISMKEDLEDEELTSKKAMEETVIKKKKKKKKSSSKDI